MPIYAGRGLLGLRRILRGTWWMAALGWFVFVGVGGEAHGQEFRGLWAVSTFTDPSPTGYSQLFDSMADANFNNVLYYAVNVGQANFPNAVFPWNEDLTGEMGADPGWDPAREAVRLAHERGLEIHAKVNLYLAWLIGMPLPTYPGHPMVARPDWLLVDRNGQPMNGAGDHYFFNPCHPEVQEALLDACLQLVRDYGFDGLHFDFIRFPNREYSWDAVTQNRFWARYGHPPDDLPTEWDAWRRDQITGLVVRIEAASRRYDPSVVFGAAVYPNVTSSPSSILQDSERWLEMGLMDYHAPMQYTTSAATFASYTDLNLSYAHGRWIFPGIAAHFMGGDLNLLDEQMTIARDRATSGVAIYQDLTLFPGGMPGPMAEALKSTWFAQPAATPPYPWKNATETDPPVFAGLIRIEPRDGMAVLEWPAAADASLPITYTIYEAGTSGAADFTTPTWATQDTRYLVEGLENGREYRFVVRAEDRFGNETGNEEAHAVTPRPEGMFLLEGFESGTSAYWNGVEGSGIVFQDPHVSGLTQGVGSVGGWAAVTSPTAAGSWAGRLTIPWSDPVGGHAFLSTAPESPRVADFTGWLSVWVYGGNDGTRLAAVVEEDGLKRTPYVTIDWEGWRKVEWFLPETSMTGLEGAADGWLRGGVFGGALAGLSVRPGGSSMSVMGLDQVANEIRPDHVPPRFAGLKSVRAGVSARLEWDLALDASNPVTYLVYKAWHPGGFDFGAPVAATTSLSCDVPLAPNEMAYFVVRARDARGNTDTNTVIRSARPEPQTIEDFESGSTGYWNGVEGNGIVFQSPLYSGTTEGVGASSHWSLSTSSVQSGAYSGSLQVVWTARPDGLCRVTTHPQRPVLNTLDATLSVWVHGSGQGERLTMILLDDLHADPREKEYERTPWVTVDWTGWRKLEWDLPETEWTSWLDLGTGALEDLEAGAHYDGFLVEPGDAAVSILLFDDLRLEPRGAGGPGQGWMLR